MSQFRLTAHLGLAFAIFGAMLWTALSLVFPARERTARSLRQGALAVAALVFFMVLTGGIVAGIRAGFAYNTFPLMNGQLVPTEILQLEPWWKNFFWNMATVQFTHRLTAFALAVAIPLLAWRAAAWLVAMLAAQVLLGISTLLLVVPLPLAALHQAGAVLLFGLALNLAHALRQGGHGAGS